MLLSTPMAIKVPAGLRLDEQALVVERCKYQTLSKAWTTTSPRTPFDPESQDMRRKVIHQKDGDIWIIGQFFADDSPFICWVLGWQKLLPWIR